MHSHSRQNTIIPLLIGVLPIFLVRVAALATDSPEIFIGLYLFLTLMFLALAIFLNASNPFFGASLVVAGSFLGICLDIAIFPTVDGFERNLFPLEIVGYTAVSAVVCFVGAGLWVALRPGAGK
tara:strand:- start:88 stop:459 length:372 start_codon:yes stop_codon:yes gene_type:complete